jgi:FkbM family methyltransferase
MVVCLPKSDLFKRICLKYLERFSSFPLPYENNCDPVTNGEYRLINTIAHSISVAFDIGANIGNWTGHLLSTARAITKIYSFEPSMAAFQKLKSLSFPSQVVLCNLALSSNRGNGELFLFGETATENSLHNRQGLEDGWGITPSEKTQKVSLETIDNFVASHSIMHIDFIKIDTEGHEVDVLRGAKDVLEKGLVDYIQFEYGGTYIDSRRLLRDVFDIIKDLEYTLHLIMPHGLRAYYRYDQRLENFQYKNFLLLHNRVQKQSVPSLK